MGPAGPPRLGCRPRLTLLAQPHLKEDKLWTLTDLRRCDVEVTSPNISTAKRMGLPSGDWSDHPLARAGRFYSNGDGLVSAR